MTLMTIDLTTEEGRRKANNDLYWEITDSCGSSFAILHQISDEMWRSNQPSPKHIEDHVKERGIKTIINLRGASPKGVLSSGKGSLRSTWCDACGLPDVFPRYAHGG